MTKKRYKRLPSDEGIGAVYKEGNYISKVRYSLRTTLEVHVIETPGQTEEINGLKSINGYIQVLEGENSLFGVGLLTLRTADGREVDFYVLRGDLVKGEFSIQGSGDFRRTGQ